jgi:rare lipoprotein A (peptidoglycan hydrolase)
MTSFQFSRKLLLFTISALFALSGAQAYAIGDSDAASKTEASADCNCMKPSLYVPGSPAPGNGAVYSLQILYKTSSAVTGYMKNAADKTRAVAASASRRIIGPVCTPAGRGVASTYATKFEGRPTSSGKPFRLESNMVAHKTLPFGTKVIIRNTETGKSVTGIVEDRGPHVRGRVVDLSRKLMRELAGATTGLIKSVELTVCK